MAACALRTSPSRLHAALEEALLTMSAADEPQRSQPSPDTMPPSVSILLFAVYLTDYRDT